jgi:hypothetical protein
VGRTLALPKVALQNELELRCTGVPEGDGLTDGAVAEDDAVVRERDNEQGGDALDCGGVARVHRPKQCGYDGANSGGRRLVVALRWAGVVSGRGNRWTEILLKFEEVISLHHISLARNDEIISPREISPS